MYDVIPEKYFLRVKHAQSPTTFWYVVGDSRELPTMLLYFGFKNV
jgi:hypothetical protein